MSKTNGGEPPPLPDKTVTARPDTQSKIIVAVTVALFIGVLSFLAMRVMNLNDQTIRLQSASDYQNREIERLREAIEKLREDFAEIVAEIRKRKQ